MSNSAVPPLSILVYSDDHSVRSTIATAIGARPSVDLPPVEIVEFATEPAVIAAVGKQHFDLLILDGEAVPAGGMGICRQLKDEVFNCPPVLVVLGREVDRWLGTWSRADGLVLHPINPRELVAAVLDLLPAAVGHS